jgi:hypothetical protein
MTFSTGVTEQVTDYVWKDCGFVGLDCGFFGSGPTYVTTTSANSPCTDPLDVCTLDHTELEPGTDIPSGVVTLVPGQTLNLSLDNPGQLEKITYLLDNPVLSDTTNVDIDPFISFTALCGSISFVGFDTSGQHCAYQTSTDLGNASYTVYQGSSPAAGFVGLSSDVVDGKIAPADYGSAGLITLGDSDSSSPAVATPEPSSFITLATGLVLMAAYARVARKLNWQWKRSRRLPAGLTRSITGN